MIQANPVRLIEHWLRCCGIGEGRRGRIYENFARKHIDALCKENAILSDYVRVCPSTVTVETEEGQRDIDLLVGLENAVLVGEVKSTGRPVMPWERRKSDAWRE